MVCFLNPKDTRAIKRMICQIRVSLSNQDFTTHEIKKNTRIFLYRSIDLLIYTFRWKRNVRKNAAVRGLQRRDHQGRIVPARSTGNPCDCRNKCFELVEPELQYHIVTTFGNLEDKVQQDMYLRGQIVASNPTWVGTQSKGGRYSETNRGKKNSTYKYYVTTGKFVGVFVLSMSWDWTIRRCVYTTSPWDYFLN